MDQPDSNNNNETARPIDASATSPSTRPDAADSSPAKTRKQKKNRPRRRRHHRQSFLAPDDLHQDTGTANAGGPTSTTMTAAGASGTGRTVADETPPSNPRPFYRLGQRTSLSETSLESEALLDHRDQPMMRPRRESRLAQSLRPESSWANPFLSGDTPRRSQRLSQRNNNASGDEESIAPESIDDRTPLIRPPASPSTSFGRYGTGQYRPPSRSSTSTRRSLRSSDRDYDVNNPPSIPGSPKAGPTMGYDDAMVTGTDLRPSTSPEGRKDSGTRSQDAVIDMDGDADRSANASPDSTPSSPKQPPPELRRRRTITLPAAEDVCFPTEEISELAEEEFARESGRETNEQPRRRRRREWPDLEVLEEWSREEKEERNGDLRVKKISEPVLVGGRLRPQYAGWRREEEEMPYRFTYFNEEFQSTIHAQTISELVQPGGSFRELFIPDPPVLDDESSSDEEDDTFSLTENVPANQTSGGLRNLAASNQGTLSRKDTRNLSASDAMMNSNSNINNHSSNNSNHVLSSEQSPLRGPVLKDKPKRYGPRPTWWLDVLSPTDTEMRVISKAFSIHALTAEDIMMQEAREKVELFRNYYFLNYRTFEQDSHSENYLQPVNMYVVVFREGILTFHFSQTPHPANVRRRIRQLRDYLLLSSDWISYALIDDITDVFGPLIQTIEDEVDDIDDTIMQMHSVPNKDTKDTKKDTKDNKSDTKDTSTIPPGDMLRRVGEGRKKVMGMYRLLSNKADVIKGFAKRCNEQWEVAPKSEIGLYLGDIQDHIMTMTSNLAHYETLLSRAHTNYLAQINILMNERQEQTADVLGKLTVLGTIVLPMNIICGMWGMNVKVPGQDMDNLYWFWSITAGLFVFGFASFLIAKRVYGIV